MNKNERFIYEFFHALWIESDLSVIDRCFSENVLIEGAVGLAMGTEGKKKIAKEWITAFPCSIGKIERVISCGEQVSVRWNANARHEGEFCGVPATGKYFSCLGDCFYHVREMKIVEYRAASTVGAAFAAEGFQLKLPPRTINYAALVNAARYINNIRFENREVEVLALKAAGMSVEKIAVFLHMSYQAILDLIWQVLDRLGVTEDEFEMILLHEGTTNIFIKIADILKKAC